MTELMKRYEEKTGKQAMHWTAFGSEISQEYLDVIEAKANISDEAIEAFQEIIRNQCDEISTLKEKAEAYDRLMSGGKKTLKEWANIFGAYFAVGKSGVGYVFRDNPPLVENTFMGQCFAIVYPEFIDFSGDWTTSLTLPDGWEDK